MKTEVRFTVFIPRIDETTWMGGKLYFDNLVSLVKLHYPNVSFCEADFDHSIFYPKNHGLRARVKRKVTKLSYLDEYRENIREFYLKKAGISTPVFFTNGILSESGGVPYIIWIPDFQFMHLKDGGTPEHIKQVEENARQGAKRADWIMLSSQDAFKDLSALMPEYKSKVKVVPFAKRIDPSYLKQDSIAVVKKYNLPKEFFYVSNQFWKHKNHIVVIDALKILKERGLKYNVVFSGHTHDFRNPLYFDDLLRHIAVQGVGDMIHFVGMIPFSDVVNLIRESVAIINPSKFEGWNTAVEEVKSVGKLLLLSDLGVHREQAAKDAQFFNPDKPEELADLMIQAYTHQQTKSNNSVEEAAILNYQHAEKKFVDDFYDLLLLSVGKSKK